MITMVIVNKQFHFMAAIPEFGSYLAEKCMNYETKDETEQTKDEANSVYVDLSQASRGPVRQREGKRMCLV